MTSIGHSPPKDIPARARFSKGLYSQKVTPFGRTAAETPRQNSSRKPSVPKLNLAGAGVSGGSGSVSSRSAPPVGSANTTTTSRTTGSFRDQSKVVEETSPPLTAVGGPPADCGQNLLVNGTIDDPSPAPKDPSSSSRSNHQPDSVPTEAQRVTIETQTSAPVTPSATKRLSARTPRTPGRTPKGSSKLAIFDHSKKNRGKDAIDLTVDEMVAAANEEQRRQMDEALTTGRRTAERFKRDESLAHSETGEELEGVTDANDSGVRELQSATLIWLQETRKKLLNRQEESATLHTSIMENIAFLKDRADLSTSPVSRADENFQQGEEDDALNQTLALLRPDDEAETHREQEESERPTAAAAAHRDEEEVEPELTEEDLNSTLKLLQPRSSRAVGGEGTLHSVSAEEEKRKQEENILAEIGESPLSAKQRARWEERQRQKQQHGSHDATDTPASHSPPSATRAPSMDKEDMSPPKVAPPPKKLPEEEKGSEGAAQSLRTDGQQQQEEKKSMKVRTPRGGNGGARPASAEPAKDDEEEATLRVSESEFFRL